MSVKSCQGCGKPASDFQCPLCQAEDKPDQGFYCSQECFATDWSAHRSAYHKSGVVREKKRTRATVAAERVEVASESVEATPVTEEDSGPRIYAPWPPMPAYNTAVTVTKPALKPDCPRAVVGAAEGDDAYDSFWPHTVAAAHHTARVMAEDRQARVLVVAGSARTAHAMAWAARCAGLGTSLRLLLSPAQTSAAMGEASPATLFSAAQTVIIATREVVAGVGGAEESGGSGAAGLWLPDHTASLLVTLPDVESAADLQGVRTRAVFFISRETPAGEWAAEERLTHTVVSGRRLAEMLPQALGPQLAMDELTWQAMPSTSDIVEDSDGDEEDGSRIDADAAADTSTPLEGKERKTSAAEDEAQEDSDAEIVMVSRQQCISNILDNALATSLARGDTAYTVQHLVRLYSEDPGHYEELLFNALCCDWGAASVAHAHHRLAYLTRRLVDASERFGARKGSSLADATLRAVTRVVRLLPPMVAETDAEVSPTDEGAPRAKQPRTEQAAAPVVPAPTAKEREDYFNYFNTYLPNIQLHATVCYLFDVAPAATLDTFASAWGLTHYLEGPRALSAAAITPSRRLVVERVTSRYTAKLSSQDAAFLVVLAHLLYDCVATYSLTVDAVAARTLWNLTLAHDVGPLRTFLADCFLLHPPVEAGAGSTRSAPTTRGQALSSRQSKAAAAPTKAGSRLALLRDHEVRAGKPTDYVRLPWKLFPLTGQRARAIARLHRAAVEEVLMAMPREPRPMYIGDVGVLIGRWFHFNARFDGVLGVTLSDFLSKHPEEFQLVGRLVTRRRAGKTEQVRVRFDHDGGSGDDDDDERGSGDRKARDRALLTGKAARRKAAERREKELPSRARKKRALKAFNKERFNRNYKSIDPSARVPGFIKRGPRRITGRGKKPNKRLVKRG